MKVGIISDTHDNVPHIVKALEVFVERGCEALIHAGDFGAPFALKALLKFPGKVYGVLGNCDGEVEGLRKLLPELKLGPLNLQLNSCRIVVIHRVRKLTDADRAEADVVICGHSHRARITPGKPLIINPGECGGWLTGKCSIAILDTDSISAELVDLGVCP